MKRRPSAPPPAPAVYYCGTCGAVANPAYGLGPPAAPHQQWFCRLHAPAVFFCREEAARAA